MRITSMTIHAFGKMHNKTFDFDQGMNIVYGFNEQGKSTIHKFIEAMFYGFFKAYTKNRHYEAAYENYLPWTFNGYGGTLTFEDGGRNYRIERQFTKGKESLAILDALTGEDLTDGYDYNKVIRMVEPGLRHFGHNKITYQNTISITQMASKTDQAMVTEIKDHMSNLASSQETTISVDKVIDKINKMENAIGSTRKKTSPYHKLTVEISDLKEAIQEVTLINQEIGEMKALEKGLLEKQEVLNGQLDALKKDLANIEALKAEALLEKVHGLEQEKLKIQGQVLANRPFKEFDLRKAEALRGHGQALRKQNQEIVGLQEKVAALINEKSKLAATIEPPVDLGQLTEDYQGLDDAVMTYRSHQQKLATKHTEYHTIEGQRGLMTTVQPPQTYQKWFLLTGLLLVLGLGLGVVVDGLFYAVALLALVVGLWLYRRQGVQGEAYKTYRRQDDRLAESLTGLETSRKALAQSMDALLRDWGVETLVELEAKRDQALTHKSIGEGQQKLMLEREDALTLMGNDIEGLLAQVKEQEESYGQGKARFEEMLEAFGLGGEEEIDQATGRFLAYSRDVASLEHLNDRLSDLLGSKSLEALKEMKVIGEGSITIQEEAATLSALEALREEGLELSRAITATVTQQIALASGTKSLAELEESLVKKEGQLKDFDHDLGVIKLMRTTIEGIAIDRQNNFAPVLNKAMSQVVESVTGGKYRDIKVNPEMNLTIYDEEAHRTIPAEALSAGTIDSLYFGLRLGMSEVLTEGRVLPLLLDDPFVQLDDQRMGQVVEMLAHQDRQVLLFTCHQREMAYLDHQGIGYHKIYL